MLSYHDVSVVANNCVYKIFELPYSVDLICNRLNGWVLVARPEKGIRTEVEIIAEEFGNSPFVLYSGTERVCHSRWRHYNGDTVIVDDTIKINTEIARVIILKPEELRIVVSASELATAWLRETITLDGSIYWSRHEWDVQEVKEISDTRTELVVGVPRSDKPNAGSCDHDGKTD